MPELPWVRRADIEPDENYVVMASRLPLKSYRFVPGFLRDTLRVRGQLGDTDGLIGYGLKAQLPSKQFWTFSVWKDRASIGAFAGAEPHRSIARRLHDRMSSPTFVFSELRGSEIPVEWEGRMQLARAADPMAAPHR